MSDKIQFQCSSCGKTLAVPSLHAGKKAKCPGCAQVLTVPESTIDQSITPLTSAPLPSSQQTPKSPSFQPPRAATPASRPAPQPTSRSQPTSNPFGDIDSMLPPVGQPASGPTFSSDSYRPPTAPYQPASFGDKTPSKPATPPKATKEPVSMGRSIAGLAAAILVGGIAAVVWLLVIVIANVEIGILAWGIGALIGLVAGVIARNPSPIYCGLTSVIAVCSILGAKVILAIVMMVMVLGVNMMEQLGGMFGGDKFTHAYVDQALADGTLQGDEITLANEYNQWFFQIGDNSGEDEGVFENDTESIIAPKVRADFNKKIKNAVKNASPEEKERWLAGAHQRHPTWIEEENHRIAALIQIRATPGKLTPELAAHANYEIDQNVKSMSGTESLKKQQAYTGNLTPVESENRSKTLRNMCLEVLKGKTGQEMDQLMKSAMESEPLFTPDLFAFTAMADKMIKEGTLDPGLTQHAQMFLNAEFYEGNTTAYADAMNKPGFEESELSLHKAVNAELVKLDSNGKKQLVQETKNRHPSWYSGEENAEEFVLDENAKKELGDGSFLGSMKQLLSPIDFLWIFLGAFSAYGAAYARAKQE